MIFLDDNEMESLKAILDEFYNLYEQSSKGKSYILNPLPCEENYEDILLLIVKLENIRSKRLAMIKQIKDETMLFSKPSPDNNNNGPERD
jgi:hypothetical protein